jgi:hypothetical protein
MDLKVHYMYENLIYKLGGSNDYTMLYPYEPCPKIPPINEKIKYILKEITYYNLVLPVIEELRGQVVKT